MLFTRFQKLDSHLGYLFEEPCLSVLPSPWHQRLGFIAKLSGTMASGWLSLGRVSKTGMTQSSSEEPLTHLAPPHASDQCGQGDLVPMGMRTSRLADMEVRLCQDLGLSPPACLCVLGGGGTKPLNLGWGKEGLFACLFFFFLGCCCWSQFSLTWGVWTDRAWLVRVSFESGVCLFSSSHMTDVPIWFLGERLFLFVLLPLFSWLKSIWFL